MSETPKKYDVLLLGWNLAISRREILGAFFLLNILTWQWFFKWGTY